MRFPPEDLTQHQLLPPWEELLPGGSDLHTWVLQLSRGAVPCPGCETARPGAIEELSEYQVGRGTFALNCGL